MCPAETERTRGLFWDVLRPGYLPVLVGSCDQIRVVVVNRWQPFSDGPTQHNDVVLIYIY